MVKSGNAGDGGGSNAGDGNAGDGGGSMGRLGREWFCGGLANAITSGMLNPLDVIKTRLQADLSLNSARANFRSTAKLLLASEGGVIGLWRPGLVASCTREMLSSGPRAGLYTPVRDFYDRSIGRGEKGNDMLICKVLAALTTGTVGAVISNPIDLVKIRLMADPKRYSSLGNALSSILQTEGRAGLIKGIVPSTLRGASIAVGELAAYDITKTTIKSLNLGTISEEGAVLHIVSSLITGLAATTMAAPFDLIKTRFVSFYNVSHVYNTQDHC